MLPADQNHGSSRGCSSAEHIVRKFSQNLCRSHREMMSCVRRGHSTRTQRVTAHTTSVIIRDADDHRSSDAERIPVTQGLPCVDKQAPALKLMCMSANVCRLSLCAPCVGVGLPSSILSVLSSAEILDSRPLSAPPHLGELLRRCSFRDLEHSQIFAGSGDNVFFENDTALFNSSRAHPERCCLHLGTFAWIGIIFSRFQVNMMPIHKEAPTRKAHVPRDPVPEGLNCHR